MVCVVISYHYLISTTLKQRWEGAWGSATLNLVQPNKKPRCVWFLARCEPLSNNYQKYRAPLPQSPPSRGPMMSQPRRPWEGGPPPAGSSAPERTAHVTWGANTAHSSSTGLSHTPYPRLARRFGRLYNTASRLTAARGAWSRHRSPNRSHAHGARLLARHVEVRADVLQRKHLHVCMHMSCACACACACVCACACAAARACTEHVHVHVHVHVHALYKCMYPGHVDREGEDEHRPAHADMHMPCACAVYMHVPRAR